MRSWTSMKRMLSTLRDALAKRGLAPYPSKCQVQTNIAGWQRRGETVIEDCFSVKVLDADSDLFLRGTILGLLDVTEKEITNRIASGSKMFWSLKRVLSNQRTSVHRRLRLFDSTVGSCVLWCCELWAPRATELRQLETARRSMIRKIVCLRQGTEEEWLDWIVRATQKVSTGPGGLLSESGAVTSSWEKWQWAGHVARSGANTWLYKNTVWRDSAWQRSCEEMGVRREVRPSKRRWTWWEDPLRGFCNIKGLGPLDELALIWGDLL